jgi:uncharacterized membrane protein (DUF441 family)
MRHPAVIAVALMVAFFTLQAAYWPITVHAGTTLHFWQLHWAAEIGYRVGAPVVGAILFSTVTGMAHEFLAVGLAVIWSIAVAWVAKVGIDNFDHQPPKKTARAAETAVTPQVSTPTAPDSAVQTPAQLARSAARPSAPSD